MGADNNGQAPRAVRGGRRRDMFAGAVAVALALVGLTLLGRATFGQESPPQPASSADGPLGRPVTSPHSAPGRYYLPASRPTRVDIPAIGVHARVVPLGLRRDGSIKVPSLTEKHAPAAWYDKSPTPGQLGASVILGHVDSARYGPAVFFKLGALKTGDTVNVARADHTVARFRVDRVVRYPKDHFPTTAVYGSTGHAALRLITCGGHFDQAAGDYRSNIVVYATLQAPPSGTG